MKYSMRCLAVLLMSLVISTANASTSSPQKILVSIHPMAMLIKNAWPHLDVEVLVPANQSPHDFALKPSDRKAIEEATWIIWLGPELEPYLSSLMAKRKNQVVLAPEANHHHDPHLWLDPHSIPELVKSISEQLNLAQPKAFLEQFERWNLNAERQLSLFKDKGFVAYHDAFHHWVEHFNLAQLAVVAVDPEKPVGSRHLISVRKILENGQARCVFVEPQFTPRLLRKLTAGLTVKQVSIDPIGSHFAVQSSAFLNYYDQLLDQFIQCLSD